MAYQEMVTSLSLDPKGLEKAYQTAVANGEVGDFKAAIEEIYSQDPDNILFSAWFHRLKHVIVVPKRFHIPWVLVIPIALITGLLFWVLGETAFFELELFSARQNYNRTFGPPLIVLFGPVAALSILIYLLIVGYQNRRVGLFSGLALLAVSGYGLVAFPYAGIVTYQEQYLTLLALHLPLVALACLGIYLLRPHGDVTSRISFLVKGLEAAGLGAVLLGLAGISIGITTGLFEALDVRIPDWLFNFLFGVAAGVMPVLTVAIIYNPTRTPNEQGFEHVIYQLVNRVMRFLVPVTLLVLIVYTAFIPFNFWEPFENRDNLIIFNVLLFVVIGLLLGASFESPNRPPIETPLWLKLSMQAVTTLTILICTYAFSALVYRTYLGGLTPNRLTFIGWNIINIVLLLHILLWPPLHKGERWLDGVYRAYSRGTLLYAAWALLVILAIPWMFGIEREIIDTLPSQIQTIVYEESPPILLRCGTDTHIFLLENGTKHWINDVDAFYAEGYQWQRVHRVTCAALREVPTGESIPVEAGPAPEI